MGVATFVQPDYSDIAQTGAVYPTNIDKAIAAMAPIGKAFACHESPTPNMTVKVDAGTISVSGQPLAVSQQTSGTIVAPVGNPRIDRVVIDVVTGSVSIVAGTPAGSPVAPSVPAGKLPVAQILLQTSTTAIANSMITDERSSSVKLGAGDVVTTKGDLIAGTAAGAVARVAAGASTPATGEYPVLVPDSGQAAGLTWTDAMARSFNPRKATRNFDDFDNGLNNVILDAAPVSKSFFQKITGTLAQVGAIFPQIAGRPGILSLSTGTTATGFAAIAAMSGSAGTHWSMKPGGGVIVCEWDLYSIPTLSNGTDRYSIFLGLSGDLGSPEPSDGIYFNYSDNLSSGQWRACTAASATRTQNGNASFVVAAATPYRLRIVINAAYSSVDFYVDDVLHSTITTNLTTSSLTPMLAIRKSVGSASRTVLADYCDQWQIFSSSR